MNLLETKSVTKLQNLKKIRKNVEKINILPEKREEIINELREVL